MMIRHRVCAALAGVLTAAMVWSPPAAVAATPERLDFETLPGPPWEVHGNVSVGGGVLHLGPIASFSVGFDPEQRGEWYSGVDNVLGWTVSARVRVDASLAGDCADGASELSLADHTIDVRLAFGAGGVCLRGGVMPPARYAMDTQSAFHTYRIDVIRQHVQLSVDGAPAVAIEAAKSNSFIGAWIEAIATAGQRTHWDFLVFDTTPSLPPCTIRGTPGDDVLEGTAGPDVICAGDGNDIVHGRAGADVLIGGFGDDQLFGGSGGDVLLGHEGFDFLRGEGGDDKMYGGPSGDTFAAARGSSAASVADGSDIMVGGDGSDTADYGRRTGGVRVTLDGRRNDGAPGENDQVGVVQWQVLPWPDVENVSGGDGADIIGGNNAANVLVGRGGADIIRGWSGNDTIDVRDRSPNDTVTAGTGIDFCVADAGDALTGCDQGPAG